VQAAAGIIRKTVGPVNFLVRSKKTANQSGLGGCAPTTAGGTAARYRRGIGTTLVGLRRAWNRGDEIARLISGRLRSRWKWRIVA